MERQTWKCSKCGNQITAYTHITGAMCICGTRMVIHSNAKAMQDFISGLKPSKIDNTKKK